MHHSPTCSHMQSFHHHCSFYVPENTLHFADFVDDSNEAQASQFIDLYSSSGLMQYISAPHISRDIRWTYCSTYTHRFSCLANFCEDRSLPSVHYAAHFTATIRRPPVSKITKQHRNLTHIDPSVLKDSSYIVINSCLTCRH